MYFLENNILGTKWQVLGQKPKELAYGQFFCCYRDLGKSLIFLKQWSG